MTRQLLAASVAAVLAGAVMPGTTVAQDKVRIVTSLTTYAVIAREIAGERGDVVSIGRGDENPHFVQPRPSFALQLQRADLFVATGLDLELWVPALIDRANNAQVREGAAGYVAASAGIQLLGVPSSVSRTEGDIHAFGNPHIWADPVNGILIGRNILAGLQRVSPANAAFFAQRYEAWKLHVLEALVGPELVRLLGAETVFDLARQRTLWRFIQDQVFEGRPLVERLGGWYATGRVFRDRQMVCYHKEWDYFSVQFGLPCVAFVEPKPGIPPTPGHVAELIQQIRTEKIPVIFSANFYDQNQVRQIARRTGAEAVIVPANAEGAPGTDTYVGLLSLWVNELARVYRASAEE